MDRFVVRDSPGWSFKVNGRESDGRLDFFVAEIAYGTGPPLHVHATQEDSFFVLDGVLTVQLDEEIVELERGDFGTAPPGVPHSLTNAHEGQGPCRVINLMTPGIGFDRYLAQIEQVASSQDAAAMDRLNAEFGITVVGPSLAERLKL